MKQIQRFRFLDSILMESKVWKVETGGRIKEN